MNSYNLNNESTVGQISKTWWINTHDDDDNMATFWLLIVKHSEMFIQMHFNML